MSDETHEYRIAHEWVYSTLKGTEYDLDEITEQLAEHMRRSWSVSAAAQGAGYWQEKAAKLEAENARLLKLLTGAADLAAGGVAFQDSEGRLDEVESSAAYALLEEISAELEKTDE